VARIANEHQLLSELDGLIVGTLNNWGLVPGSWEDSDGDGLPELYAGLATHRPKLHRTQPFPPAHSSLLSTGHLRSIALQAKVAIPDREPLFLAHAP